MIRQATGLNVSRAQADRAIRQRMDDTGEVNREHYLATLSPDELTELVELLVVPESWMFRDPQAFVAAVEYAQARLARDPRPVRILSVPCAGGEEPYSMAMALFDAGVKASGFTIDAVDLSPACVARARAGLYGRNAFRSKDLAFRDRYFEAIDSDTYRISDAVRAQVRISQGNLLAMDTASRAGYYDMIFCRNLLIYFDKPTTVQAIARLSAMLDDDGMLFAGYAEVPSFTQHGFTPLPHRYAFALKKDAEPAPRHASPARPVDAMPARQRTAPRPVPPAGSQGTGAANAGTGAAQRTRAPLPQAGGSAVARHGAVPAAAGQGGAKGGKGGSGGSGGNDAASAGIGHARALADRGQHGQAADACLAILATDPHSPAAAEAYFILGMLREQAHDVREADQFWRRCIYLQPDHYEALCHLALLTEQQGDMAAAAALKARARRIYQRGNATRTDT
jgi:chemotaxis protein methyltransferase WspC